MKKCILCEEEKKELSTSVVACIECESYMEWRKRCLNDKKTTLQIVESK
jgi:hypothetical protein